MESVSKPSPRNLLECQARCIPGATDGPPMELGNFWSAVKLHADISWCVMLPGNNLSFDGHTTRAGLAGGEAKAQKEIAVPLVSSWSRAQRNVMGQVMRLLLLWCKSLKSHKLHLQFQSWWVVMQNKVFSGCPLLNI